MSQDIMNKPLVLQLNANWMPIDQKTLKEAVIAMTSQGDEPSAKALDIEYARDENGDYDFANPIYMNPVGWSDWISLPVRDFDFVIHSAKLAVRAPTVLIAPGYRKMPTMAPRATKFNIFERDRGVCQYTGKKISKTQGNVDHILPLSKGGKNTWENMVWTSAELNSRKGNKLNHEVGLTLIKAPTAPRPMPVSMKFREARHPTWAHFLVVDN